MCINIHSLQSEGEEEAVDSVLMYSSKKWVRTTRFFYFEEKLGQLLTQRLEEVFFAGVDSVCVASISRFLVSIQEDERSTYSWRRRPRYLNTNEAADDTTERHYYQLSVNRQRWMMGVEKRARPPHTHTHMFSFFLLCSLHRKIIFRHKKKKKGGVGKKTVFFEMPIFTCSSFFFFSQVTPSAPFT